MSLTWGKEEIVAPRASNAQEQPLWKFYPLEVDPEIEREGDGLNCFRAMLWGMVAGPLLWGAGYELLKLGVWIYRR